MLMSAPFLYRRESITYPLLCGIGVIEPEKQLALVHFRKVLVEHSSLGVANVQVATGLRGETGYDLSLNCTRQTKRE